MTSCDAQIQVHCATGAYEEALQCLDKAVKLDPSKVLPRFDSTPEDWSPTGQYHLNKWTFVIM